MKRFFTLIMLLVLSASVAACGVKRDLKHPSDVQKKEQKKQQRREGAV